MFLTAPNLAHYLLYRGRLSMESLVVGDFQVIEAKRRNRNFKVLRKQRPGLFVKQIAGFENQAVTTLQREAACYRLVSDKPEFAALAKLMPKLIDYDPVRHVLVLELLPEGENLTEYHMRRNEFPEEIGRMLGEGLGAYHSDAGRLLSDRTDDSVFPRMVPWILSIHHGDDAMFGHMSAGNTQLVKIIRQFPDYQKLLDDTRALYRHDSLIHGDIKWDNCLILPDEDGKKEGSPEFRIVDWELADFGDARWDTGAVFQSYLTYWVMRMNVGTGLSIEQSVAQAPFALEALQPAMQAFWHSYAKARKLKGAAAEEELDHCLRFGAARMVQTAFEMTHSLPQVSNHAVIILQLSLNILKNPRQAVTDILGLEISPASA